MLNFLSLQKLSIKFVGLTYSVFLFDLELITLDFLFEDFNSLLQRLKFIFNFLVPEVKQADKGDFRHPVGEICNENEPKNDEQYKNKVPFGQRAYLVRNNSFRLAVFPEWCTQQSLDVVLLLLSFHEIVYSYLRVKIKGSILSFSHVWFFKVSINHNFTKRKPFLSWWFSCLR